MKNNFEKLNNGIWKKIMIGSTCLVAVLSVGVLATSRAKYKLTESINIVNGTINYKVPDLKVMAMFTSDDGTNYTEITTMPESGYVINEEKTYCTTDNVNQVKGKAYTNSSGELVFKNLTKSDKCYLYFDKYTPPITVDSIIAGLNAKTTTPIFSSAATTDEGVYKVSDGMYGGYSYYWRGAATTNYVKFAGFCWRIVRINGDKTMRLIYDGATCHANGAITAESIAVASVAYNSNYNQSNYVGWTYTGTSQRTTGGTSCNAKTQLESWYKTNITDKGYGGKVASGKYCNDRNAGSGFTWAINGSTFQYAVRIRNDSNSPTLTCPAGDVYTLNVGLITVDEAMYAGGRGVNNTSYYLYNGQDYWTMSPSYWLSSGYVRVFLVGSYGILSGDHDMFSTIPGVRPVINLRSDITFSSGDGTLNNPYTVI